MEGNIWELSGVCCFRTRNSESECGKHRKTGASDPNRHLSSPLGSRQVALRQADPRCGERALEQKQRHSEGDVSRLLTDRWCDCDRESHNTAKLQCAKSLFENTFNGAICI